MRLIDADEAKKQIKQMQVLKPSEKTLLMLALDRTPTYEPPNDPLTLDELREMDGEPVLVFNSSTKKEEGFSDEWALVSVRRKNAESTGTIYHFENYEDAWRAYRRKPEEGTP